MSKETPEVRVLFELTTETHKPYYVCESCPFGSAEVAQNFVTGSAAAMAHHFLEHCEAGHSVQFASLMRLFKEALEQRAKV